MDEHGWGGARLARLARLPSLSALALRPLWPHCGTLGLTRRLLLLVHRPPQARQLHIFSPFFFPQLGLRMRALQASFAAPPPAAPLPLPLLAAAAAAGAGLQESALATTSSAAPVHAAPLLPLTTAQILAPLGIGAGAGGGEGEGGADGAGEGDDAAATAAGAGAVAGVPGPGGLGIDPFRYQFLVIPVHDVSRVESASICPFRPPSRSRRTSQPLRTAHT